MAGYLSKGGKMLKRFGQDVDVLYYYYGMPQLGSPYRCVFDVLLEFRVCPERYTKIL